MKEQIITKEQLLNELKTGTDKGMSIQNISEVITKLINKQSIERISRIRDVELDNICRMLFFGIKHTALLNNDLKLNYAGKQDFELENMEISAILDYTMINLSLRLSLGSESRKELRDVVINMIASQLEIMKQKIKGEKEKNV